MAGQSLQTARTAHAQKIIRFAAICMQTLPPCPKNTEKHRFFQAVGKKGARNHRKSVFFSEVWGSLGPRNQSKLSAMYPQCMFFDPVGILLNDFINQTLGSTFESICCDVHCTVWRPQQDALGQRSSAGREGQSRGDGKREPTNCHSLEGESDRGRDGGGGPKSQKSKVYPQSHSV